MLLSIDGSCAVTVIVVTGGGGGSSCDDETAGWVVGLAGRLADVLTNESSNCMQTGTSQMHKYRERVIEKHSLETMTRLCYLSDPLL